MERLFAFVEEDRIIIAARGAFDLRIAGLLALAQQRLVSGGLERLHHRLRIARAYQPGAAGLPIGGRSEEHTSELQSLMRISYAVFCLKKKTHNNNKRIK